MNTVNYQPTGVYQQFVKNPALLSGGKAGQSQTFAAKQSANPIGAAQNLNYTDKPQNQNGKKNQKDKSFKAEKAALLLGVAGALLCGGAIISNYKKGVGCINKGNEFIEKIQKQYSGKDFSEKYNAFLKNNSFGKEARVKYDKIITDFNTYNNNFVGKIHRGIGAIQEFIKDTFYGY